MADQDDVWDADKLIIAISKLKTINSSIPALYYSNLRVVDENLIFCRNCHEIPMVGKGKYSSLMESLPAGCTEVYNRALTEMLFGHEPEYYSMHDRWIYDVAMFFGKVIYDFEPHINYRQHSSNQVGAIKKHLTIKKAKLEIKKVINGDNNYQLKNVYNFAKQYRTRLSTEEKHKLLKVLNYKKSPKNKLIIILDKDIRSASIYRNLIFHMQILLGTF